MRIKFRLLSLLAALGLVLNVAAVTFNYESQAAVDQTIDGVRIVLGAGANTTNGPTYLDNGYTKAMRLYKDNTITVTGDKLTSIQLMCSKTGKAFASLTCTANTYTPGDVPEKEGYQTIDKWEGQATSVKFTMGSGQRHLIRIVVNGDPIDLEPQTDLVEMNVAEWNPGNTSYSEPTIVTIPDTNFFKKEYVFVQKNIRVSCSQGSIINNDTANYFNCNAGYSITFEAAKPMKGLVINGAVRKLFSASVDKGTMSYLVPDEFYPEDYQECDPVIVISDIDATTVSILCVKQLRCYAVKIYFDNNPTEEIECGEQRSTEAIEEIPALNSNAPMFDILGQEVDKTYRGIVIQNGNKYLLK